MKAEWGVFTMVLLIGLLPVTALSSDGNEPKPTLELKVFSTDHIILNPVDIEFKLTNTTDRSIQNIIIINHLLVGMGIKIHLEYNGETRIVKHPEITTDRERTPVKFELKPGESTSYRTFLTLDWGHVFQSDMMLFATPGTYTIYGTHPVPGYGVIESNRVEVEYRGPVTENEIKAVGMLEPFGNYLQYIYDPGHLSSVKDVAVIHELVAIVRKVYELSPETLYKPYMKEALRYWQRAENRTKGQTPPPVLKEKEFDKLGLQDLKLD